MVLIIEVETSRPSEVVIPIYREVRLGRMLLESRLIEPDKWRPLRVLHQPKSSLCFSDAKGNDNKIAKRVRFNIPNDQDASSDKVLGSKLVPTSSDVCLSDGLGEPKVGIMVKESGPLVQLPKLSPRDLLVSEANETKILSRMPHQGELDKVIRKYIEEVLVNVKVPNTPAEIRLAQ